MPTPEKLAEQNAALLRKVAQLEAENTNLWGMEQRINARLERLAGEVHAMSQAIATLQDHLKAPGSQDVTGHARRSL